jgi:hypothetical protein
MPTAWDTPCTGSEAVAEADATKAAVEGPADLGETRPRLRRIFFLMLGPAREWASIAEEPVDMLALFTRWVLPWSLLAPLASMVGIRFFDWQWSADYGYRVPHEAMVSVGAGTFAFSLLAPFLLAAFFWWITPVYRVRRSYRRAFAIAVFGTVPMWLTAPFLFLMPMIMLSMLAFFYSCVQYAIGVERVLEIERDAAADFVAVALTLFTVASILLGGLGGSLGLL